MARNGYPDDPDNYSEREPTQYANYGGTGGEAYSEYAPTTDYPPSGYTSPTAADGGTGRYPAAASSPVPLPTPWHQRPVILVGLGALTAVVLALLVYAVVKFTNAGSKDSPAVTSNSVATTSSAPASSTAEQSPSTATETVAPSPSTTAAPPPPPTTVTTTVTPTTTVTSTSTVAPTTTEAPTPSTTTSVTTSVTTVTETTTRPLFPNWPRPTRPTLMEPAPAG